MKSCRPLLGTYVEVRVFDGDEQSAARAIESAFRAVTKVQQLMSVHRADSDVRRINREAHRQVVTVDPWTTQVLRTAQDVYHESDGIFDCGVARQLARWGLLPADVIDHQCSDVFHASVAHLQILDDTHVTAACPMALDLGGIAKGFAVDKAAEALQEAGVTSAVVNAGGDLRVIGEVEEAIHVRSARDPRLLRPLGHLKDGAVATSGSYFSRENAAVPDVSALVDPRDGKPVLSEQSFSVVAPTCAIADALTKVLAITGNPLLSCFTRFSAHPLIV